MILRERVVLRGASGTEETAHKETAQANIGTDDETCVGVVSQQQESAGSANEDPGPLRIEHTETLFPRIMQPGTMGSARFAQATGCSRVLRTREPMWQELYSLELLLKKKDPGYVECVSGRRATTGRPGADDEGMKSGHTKVGTSVGGGLRF